VLGRIIQGIDRYNIALKVMLTFNPLARMRIDGLPRGGADIDLAAIGRWRRMRVVLPTVMDGLVCHGSLLILALRFSSLLVAERGRVI
jgi:hypothetical protein